MLFPIQMWRLGCGRDIGSYSPHPPMIDNVATWPPPLDIFSWMIGSLIRILTRLIPKYINKNFVEKMALGLCVYRVRCHPIHFQID